MPSRPRALAPLLGSLIVLAPAVASAATLTVGAHGTYATIAAAWAKATAGDVIEVEGGATYTGSIKLTGKDGAAGSPITVRGRAVDGRRPVLTGIGPGQWDNMVVWLNASHLVFEGFEIVGSGNPKADDYCLLHMADDVTVRDVVVHDCRHQAGLVGNDSGSGSLTLEYSEFFHNGDGEYSHQIYMATDQAAFPHSVFRMQHCYVHDGLGGNNVKSRAERNEIYANWIEGAYYHELDLIGPDVGGTSRRCDSDVVGNVLVKSSEWRIARIGGDGSGDSMGRFRFVANTMVLAPASTTAIGLQFTVDALEMHDNVIVAGGPNTRLYHVDDATGPAPTFAGSGNWVTSGVTALPAAWTGTSTGADPGFVDAAHYDFRPSASSPLVGHAVATTVATGAHAFPSPLAKPAFFPPPRRLLAPGTAEARASLDAIGALEPTATAPTWPPGDAGYAEPDGGGGGGGGATPTSAEHGSGCGCRVPAQGERSSDLAAVGAALVAFAGARRRRRRGA
jgi:MYXO-CTERM domain-containing protein